MVRWVRTRDGEIYEKDWAIKNANKIGYPQAYIQAVIDHSHREADGTVHVTDMIGCMKRNMMKKFIDYTVDLEAASNTLVGTALHDYFRQGDTEHKLSYEHNGIPIRGSIDLLELHPGCITIYDVKGAKSFKVMKTLGIQKVDEQVFDEDGNPVYYKSGKKAGQPKTRKVPYRRDEFIDAIDYEQQLNTYAFMLRHQIVSGNDPFYSPDQPSIFPAVDKIETNIFFLIKDFGKDSNMNGIETNTVIAPIRRWDDLDVQDFLDRAEVIAETLDSDGIKLPPCPTDSRDTWHGRMCEKFCEFSDQCFCFGGNDGY